MTERSRFIKGTVILICANAVAKILGAVFKIPLTYILEEEGMAVYNTAFSVYVMMLSLATGGFPFALTKLLAEYTALGRDDRIRPAVGGVGAVLFVLGLAASLAMYAFAPQLAMSMREPNAAGAIRAVSASVVLVALGAVIKSSNEARGDLLPTAFSQVTEAALKLFCGFYLATRLVHISVYSAAEGAILGVTAGEAFATSLLFIVWRIRVRRLPKSRLTRSELKSICSVAVPLMITGCMTGLLGMAEVSVIRGALSAITFSSESAEGFLLRYSSYTDVFDSLPQLLCLTPDGARKLYGAYSGYAQTVFNLPVGIIGTISAAATPMLASALTRRDKAALLRAANRVLGLIFMLAVPASAVCFFFSNELLTLLFGNSFSAAMLSSLAPSMVFLCAGNMMIAALHLSGKILEPFCAVSVGLILKIILSAVMIRIPEINILGAGLAVSASSAVIFVMLARIFAKSFGIHPSFIKLAAPGAAASCVLIGVMRLLYPVFGAHFPQTAAFLLCALSGGVGYILTVALLARRGDTVFIIKNKTD